jgi:glutamine synthetase
VSIARSQILPAAIEHQTLLAQAVSATEAAEVDCEEDREALREFVGNVSRLRGAIVVLEKACAHHVADPHRHATHINSKVKPAMDALREVVDTLELHVAADLWPLPTYRELLFLK